MRIRAGIAVGLCVLCLAGCGSNGMAQAGSVDMGDGFEGGIAADSSMGWTSNAVNGAGADYDYEGDVAAEPSESEAGTDISAERKLVTTVRIDAETQEYDSFLAWVETSVAAAGGYVEYMNEQQNVRRYPYTYDYAYTNGLDYAVRSADYTFRVPADKTDTFLEQVGANCNVVSRSSNIDDETFHYIDLQTHYDSLKTEYGRLEALMSKADRLEDILTLESKMTDLRWQIQEYDMSLQTLDRRVSYSTIHLFIQEVKELTDIQPGVTGFFQELRRSFIYGANQFKLGLQNFAIWVAGHVFSLLVFAAIVYGIFRFCRYMRRRKGSVISGNEPRRQLFHVRLRKKAGHSDPQDETVQRIPGSAVRVDVEEDTAIADSNGGLEE